MMRRTTGDRLVIAVLLAVVAVIIGFFGADQAVTEGAEYAGIVVAIASTLAAVGIAVAAIWRRCARERGEVQLAVGLPQPWHFRPSTLGAICVLVAVLVGAQQFFGAAVAECLVVPLAGIWLARNGKSHFVFALVPLALWVFFLLDESGVIPSPRGDAGLSAALMRIAVSGILILLSIFGSLAWYQTGRRRYCVAALVMNGLTFLLFFLYWTGRLWW
jgi:hypothetical protein